MERVTTNSFRFNITLMKLLGLCPPDSAKSRHKVYSYVVYVLATMPTIKFGLPRCVFKDGTREYSPFTDAVTIAIFYFSAKSVPFLINGEKIKKCIHYFDRSCNTAAADKPEEIIAECLNTCKRISNVLIATAYAALACALIDPLIGGLSHHAVVQIKILQHRLQHLDSYANGKFASKTNRGSARIYNEIIKCILHHQFILDFLELYEECFSPVVFAQFTSSGLLIGLLCFQISKTVTMDVNFFISLINVLLEVFFQIFFYCYYGEMLIQESTNLATAIYMSRWYEYDIESKRALIILMERTKSRAMVVRGRKLFDLSMDTLTIVKKGYSIVAVLKKF